MVPDGPEVKTQWFKDGKPIQVPSDKYDEKIVGNKRILVVKGASMEDQGQFSCETPKFKSSANLAVTTKRESTAAGTMKLHYDDMLFFSLGQ